MRLCFFHPSISCGGTATINSRIRYPTTQSRHLWLFSALGSWCSAYADERFSPIFLVGWCPHHAHVRRQLLLTSTCALSRHQFLSSCLYTTDCQVADLRIFSVSRIVYLLPSLVRVPLDIHPSSLLILIALPRLAISSGEIGAQRLEMHQGFKQTTSLAGSASKLSFYLQPLPRMVV